MSLDREEAEEAGGATPGRGSRRGSRPPLLLAVLVLSLLAATVARGQLPSPRIARLVPPGGGRGTTLEVTLQGEHLEELYLLRFADPSIRATHKEGATFRLEIQKDAALGVHQCWAAGRWGAAYPVGFAVDDLKELTEIEPNNTPQTAQPLPLESVLNGSVGAAADMDHFKLSLKAGQRVFIDCLAERIESELDPVLRLHDPQGKSIAYSRDYQGVDAFLDVTAPADGDYVLLLHHFLYQGSADCYYRLRVTERPQVDFVIPAAVAAGTTAEVKVYGRKLPGGTPAGAHWLDGRPLVVATARIEAPLEPGPLLSRFGGDRLPQMAKVDLFDFRFPLPGGSALPVPVGFARGTVLLEVEPNDEPQKAQAVPVPCDLTGQFDTEYDRDWVEFEAKKGDKLWIEVIAARLGSPVDPILTLTRADAGSTFIQEVDDDGEQVAGKRFDTRGSDPAFHWEPPEDGRYRLMVRDINAGRRGLGLFYRLVIEKEEPSFRLFLLSSRPQGPGALTLRRGGAEHYEVHALRRMGYEGTIRVEAIGLPIGVSSPPVVLGPKSVFAPLVFLAEPGAPVEASAVQVVASGWSALERADRSGVGYVVEKIAADDNSSPNLVRQIGGLPMAVVEDPSPFSLLVSPERINLKPGEKQPLKVQVKRTAPFDGEVALSLLASVPGLKLPTGKIEKGKEEAALELQLDNSATPGRYSLAVLGEADVPFSKTPAEKKQNVKARFPSPPLALDVVAPPFELKLADLHGGKLPPGGSLAVEIQIQKKFGFDGPLLLTLVPPEAVKDLQAAEVRVLPGASTATLTVKAAAGGANPGPRKDLIVRAACDFYGSQVSVDLKLTLEVEPKK